LVAYAKQFSQQINHSFTDRTILLTALTGAAATEIGGRTTASVFGYMKKTSCASQKTINFFMDTRLNIIDEISFASYHSVLGRISENLKNYTQQPNYTFGSIDMCFLGDFCQLEPIGKDPLYKYRNGVYWEQALNCMVELKGTHRFNNCKEMMRIMPNMRDGTLSAEDRRILNSRVINGDKVKKPNPLKTKYATFFNIKRAELNASVFQNYLMKFHTGKSESEIPMTAITIKATTRWNKSKINLTFDQRKILFEECSEADCRQDKKMASPLLCLFTGCNLMVTINEDVVHGIANGTTCIFRKVVLKPDSELEKIKMYGVWVYTISIEFVEYIEVEWQDCDKFIGRFRLTPETGVFRVKFPISQFGLNTRIQASIQFQYFSVVVNHATTGHKLQGKTVESLVIAEWSRVKNWAYVVISRVKTLDGLFLMKPIPDDIDFSPANDYLEMMKYLRGTILATPEQVADLKLTLN
jgi:hypothetical protein